MLIAKIEKIIISSNTESANAEFGNTDIAIETVQQTPSNIVAVANTENSYISADGITYNNTYIANVSTEEDVANTITIIKVLYIEDYRAMFPDTSFSSSGPSPEFMEQNSCMYVNTWLPYDATTQKLVSCEPYVQIDDPNQPLNWVYTVEVAELTPEEIEQMHQTQAQQNKQMASNLLYETDWTTIPDITNPINNPYLLNQDEFIAYRNEIRKIAVYPTWDAVFPEKPKSKWSDPTLDGTTLSN